MELDAYFRPQSPHLPRWLGHTDWNDCACFDEVAAGAAVEGLLVDGQTMVPIYDLSTDQVVGTREMSISSEWFVAEGVFAPLVYPQLSRFGDAVTLLTLKTNPITRSARKIRRDVREHRLPAHIAVLTALRLCVGVPAGQGHRSATKCGQDEAERLLRALAN